MDPMNVRFEYQGNDYEEFVKSKPIPEKRFLLKVRKNIGKEKICLGFNCEQNKLILISTTEIMWISRTSESTWKNKWKNSNKTLCSEKGLFQAI